MPREIPKSLFDADFHELWRISRRFFARPLRVSAAKDQAEHFTGGASSHTGCKCQKCEKPLMLLWDIDLCDKLVPEFVRRGYAPATRLPLYICWQCVAASYAVLSDTKMQVFDDLTDYLTAEETPFQDPSNKVERRSIALSPIPSTVDALLSLADVVGLDALDDSARKTLDAYLGEEVTSEWDLPISQLGGAPLAYQGHRNLVCPNPKCPANRLKHPYGELEVPFLMKDLAMIHQTDEPVLAAHCFQLLYSVCGICFSIRAEYRCS